MKDTAGKRLTLTHTACKRAAQKGWTAEVILDAFNHPAAVVENDEHPGQFKVVGKDLTIVGVEISDTEFRGITMFTK